MKKLKYILKLHYVINHVIFDFFLALIFLIRRIVKIDVNVKDDKHLGIEGVSQKQNVNIDKQHALKCMFVKYPQ
jgi:hypothetical protein